MNQSELVNEHNSTGNDHKKSAESIGSESGLVTEWIFSVIASISFISFVVIQHKITRNPFSARMIAPGYCHKFC